MKATKKIVGAACALVAAVALSAGSTYAWFTSNGTVTAKGLEIDVNTNNSFLIIGSQLSELRPASADDTTFAYKKDISLAPSGDVTKLLPSAYETTATLDASGTGSIVDPGSWYTAQGTSPTDGTMDTTTKEMLDADGKVFSNYVVVTDIYVSVAVGSQDVSKVELAVRPATGSTWSATNSEATNNDPITIVILSQTIEYDGGTLGTWTKNQLDNTNGHGAASKLDLGGVTEDDYIHIKVMVYFDGNNTDVKSANAANLTGITLDFTFTDGTETTPSGGEGA